MGIAQLFVIYPISRVFEEMLRADNPLDTFGFTISQAISLASVPVALLVMFLLRYLPERSPRAVAELEAKQMKTARPAEK